MERLGGRDKYFGRWGCERIVIHHYICVIFISTEEIYAAVVGFHCYTESLGYIGAISRYFLSIERQRRAAQKLHIDSTFPSRKW